MHETPTPREQLEGSKQRGNEMKSRLTELEVAITEVLAWFDKTKPQREKSQDSTLKAPNSAITTLKEFVQPRR
jgi:hypothetical protein